MQERAQVRRVRARPGEGGRLREEILEAADRLLAEAGAEDALTLRAVAAAAGVSTPSVYLHFADRDALLEAVCIRAWGQLGELFQRARTPDPLHTLGAFGRAYGRFALDHPVQYRVLLMRPVPAGSRAAAESCFALMRQAVSACVDAGVLEGDPRTLALHLWSAVHGCVSLLITQPQLPWPADLDAYVADAVRIAGFGAAVQSRLPAHPSAAALTALLGHPSGNPAVRPEPPPHAPTAPA